jgi:hypothetical protein
MAFNFSTLTNTKLIDRLSEGFASINDPEYTSFIKSIDTKLITSTLKRGILEGAKLDDNNDKSKKDILFIISTDDVEALVVQMDMVLKAFAKIEKEVIDSYLQTFYNDENIMEYANKKLPSFINITLSADKVFDTKGIDNIIKWIDCTLAVLSTLTGMDDGYDIVKFIRKYIYTSIKEHDLQTLVNSKIPEYMYDITTIRTMISLSVELKDYVSDILGKGYRNGYEANVIDVKKVRKFQRLYNEFQQVAWE